jgi:hypothetical protein|nr:MAG TPA: LEM3 (ligand-effect modulator 3) family / CDC50 family [Bacteriophage sp.]
MNMFLGLLFLYLSSICLIIAFFIGASETDEQE